MFTSLSSWFKQPTTVAGISGLVGTLAGLATGGVSLSSAAPLAVSALVAMVLPDNTAAAKAAQATAADALSVVSALTKKPTAVPPAS